MQLVHFFLVLDSDPISPADLDLISLISQKNSIPKLYFLYYIYVSFAVILLVNFTSNISFISDILSFIGKFFNYATAGIMTGTLLCLRLSKNTKFYLMLILFFEIILKLLGSSAAIIKIIIPVFFGLLSTVGNLFIPVYLLLLSPFVLIFSFLLGSSYKFKDSLALGGYNISLYSNLIDFSTTANKFLLDQVYARSGFLDFSVDIVANAKVYARYINLERYFMALCDALTPGFDFFGIPLVSNGLRGAYLQSAPEFLGRLFSTENYHSDQLNAFPEAYVLFGPFLACLFLYLIGIIFAFAYVILNRLSNTTSYFYSAYILYLFYVFLNSFGFDHFFAVHILDLMFSMFGLLILKSLFRVKPPTGTQPTA